jgi:hypothetical protein
MRYALAFMVWGAGFVSAYGAEMCAPGTDNTVCALIEELDNTDLGLAKAEGGRRDLLAKNAADQAWWKGYLQGEAEQTRQREVDHQALAEWWKAYVSGLPDGVTLAAHIDRACGWKGTLNEPTAQLCAWWKGLAR